MTSIANSKSSAMIAILTFFVIFIPLTGFFEYAVVKWNYGGWITGMMWSVGVAAIITCLVLRRPLSSLGWGFGKPKYLLLAFFLPIGYSLFAFLIIIGLGLGVYDAEHVNNIVSKRAGVEPQSLALQFIVFVVFLFVSRMGGAVANALGEEIGWRGFLVPEFAKLMPFTAVCIVSGLIWGLWHFPIIFGASYGGAEAFPTLDAAKFLTATTLASFPMVYLRLRSGSLWTAAIFHGSHNLFMNDIFRPLLVEGPGRNLMGEFGWISIGIMVFVAAFFWIRARSKLASVFKP